MLDFKNSTQKNSPSIFTKCSFFFDGFDTITVEAKENLPELMKIGLVSSYLSKYINKGNEVYICEK